MPVSIAPSRPLARTDRPAPAPCRVPVALDLSATGVPTSGLEAVAPSVVKADVAHLARLARSAVESGAHTVLVGPDYRLATGRRHATDAWLDPAVAVRRLGADARDLRVVPALAVPHDGLHAAASLAELTRDAGWAALDVRPAHDPFGVHDADELTRRLLEVVAHRLAAADLPRGARPDLVAHASTPAQAAHAGRYADVVRLEEADLAAARELRYAARAAATAAGRDADALEVLVDVRVVVSGDGAAARERRLLLEALAGAQSPRVLDATGPALEVAALLSRWVLGGAADGFVALPGSLEADVAALLGGVLPELAARHPRD